MATNLRDNLLMRLNADLERRGLELFYLTRRNQNTLRVTILKKATAPFIPGQYVPLSDPYGRAAKIVDAEIAYLNSTFLANARFPRGGDVDYLKTLENLLAAIDSPGLNNTVYST